MKLDFMMIPKTTAGVNARSLCTQDQWDRARIACYQKAGYICEACGDVGPDHPVECHEVWEWDFNSMTQRLVKLAALCPLCHQAVHINFTVAHVSTRVAANALYELLINHVAEVNHWSPGTVQGLVQVRSWGLSLRDNLEWIVDVSLVRDFEEQPSKFELDGYEI